MLLQITAALLNCYKLRQLFVLLQCTSNTLLQITAGITIYGVITNYVLTMSTWMIGKSLMKHHCLEMMNVIVT